MTAVPERLVCLLVQRPHLRLYVQELHLLTVLQLIKFGVGSIQQVLIELAFLSWLILHHAIYERTSTKIRRCCMQKVWECTGVFTKFDFIIVRTNSSYHVGYAAHVTSSTA